MGKRQRCMYYIKVGYEPALDYDPSWKGANALGGYR
jgi:hypothetical protein